jgi:hypothetical protein
MASCLLFLLPDLETGKGETRGKLHSFKIVTICLDEKEKSVSSFPMGNTCF